MEARIDVHSGSINSLSSHRHVLIAPIFVVVLLLSSVVAVGGRGLNNVRGLLVESVWVLEVRTAGEREVFALEGGVKGIAFPHTQMHTSDHGVELFQGSVLLFAPQRLELTVGPWRSIGFGGSFRVFSQGTSVTVVALTSPVLIAGADGWEVLVPVGMQWQSSSPASHPPTHQEAPADRPGRNGGASGAGFRISGMREKPQAKFSEARGASLRRIPSTFLEEQEEELGALGTSALLTYTGASREPLPISSGDEEWVLFSIHPLMREEFWLSQPPLWEFQELKRLALLGFPQADILQRAMLPLVTTKWVDDISTLLKGSKEPGEFLGELFRAVQPLILQWEKQGLVERAERYGTAVVAITPPYRDALSRAGKRRLKAIEDFLVHLGVPRIGGGEILVEQSDDSSDTSPRSLLASIAPPSLPTGAVEREVYEVFREAGALFTVETRIVPIDASRAKVEGIVFGGEGGDRTLDFTYDLSTGEVSEIMEGETHYPFAVPLPKFLEWVRG